MMATQKRLLPDGEEHWFLDESWTNRMVLALRSGIDEEVSWSLYRLLTLSSQHGPRFFLNTLPGLTDVLFDWPLWWVKERGGIPTRGPAVHELFWSIPADVKQRRKHAIESLLILRNASFNEVNATQLIDRDNWEKRTLPLLWGIDSLSKSDSNTEFITYCIEIFQALAPHIDLAPPNSKEPTPLEAVQKILATSNDRTLILASMTAITIILNKTSNKVHIKPDSPVLLIAIQYLPLTVDRPLLTASLDYLFAHLSHTPAAKAFMHHPRMPDTLRLLVDILVSEQRLAPKTVPIAPPILTAPEESKRALYQLSAEELQVLVQTPEPQRAMNWMSKMFVHAPGEEETQVTFWNLYRDTFTPYQDTCVGGISNATEVIKNIMIQFPKANAIVVPGAQPRFVIKNVKRREVEGAFQCKWNRLTCTAERCQSLDQLCNHLQEHFEKETTDEQLSECQWATCTQPPMPTGTLRAHVFTHLPSPPKEKNPDQPLGITLPYEPYPHPSAKPTSRPPPPPPAPVIHYEIPIPDPPGTSLTALLILRLLFRVAFSDPGPPPPGADENRFGFPMPPALAEGMSAVGDDRNKAMKDAMELDDGQKAMELEGERKGQRAFRLISNTLAQVNMGDELPAAWVAEMLDAAKGEGIGEWGS